MIRTIETTAVVAADHTITLKVPDDVPAGQKGVVVVTICDDPTSEPMKWANWAPHRNELTDPQESFRREEIYGAEDC